MEIELTALISLMIIINNTINSININTAGAVFAAGGSCSRIPPRSAPPRIGTEPILCRNRTKSLMRFL